LIDMPDYAELKDRAETKIYEVKINGVPCSTTAQSLGQALRHAGDLRLKDTDVVTVRLEA